MKVLVAIDGSKASELVLERALEQDWPGGTIFCFITVLDPFFFSHEMVLLGEARNSARRFLKETAGIFESKGYSVMSEVILGNPRQAISECSETWRADLLLVGSHGLSGLERLALGSTVQAILRHAKCSVEVRRGRKKDSRNSHTEKRILVATDGSEFSKAAVDGVNTRPWPAETEIKVISVPQTVSLIGAIPFVYNERLDQLRKESLETARQAAEGGREILAKSGLRTTAEVTAESSSPAGRILEEADRWDADLIVVGSHGRRGFDRFTLGSVSDSVAMNAHCSVEVVRLPQQEEIVDVLGEEHESEGSNDSHFRCVL
jgi:nucleotide-binding universal stress UspA family protein